MTTEDEQGLSEEDMDEIVNRVVDQLGQAGVGADEDDDGGHEIEVRTGEETGGEGAGEATDDDSVEAGTDHDGADAGSAVDDDTRDNPDRDDSETRQDHGRRRTEEADRRREEAHRRKREAKRRAEEAREAAAGMEDLGDRIERAVEARLDHLGEHLEHALGPGPADPPEPTMPGVVIGPDDTREKAVYKTQLQKGGRVAVPDTEIEALGLEPGDALQVVLYPVE